jgi:hypothetical protein
MKSVYFHCTNKGCPEFEKPKNVAGAAYHAGASFEAEVVAQIEAGTYNAEARAHNCRACSLEMRKSVTAPAE